MLFGLGLDGGPTWDHLARARRNGEISAATGPYTELDSQRAFTVGRRRPAWSGHSHGESSAALAAS
jgi:hypothetical protein